MAFNSQFESSSPIGGGIELTGLKKDGSSFYINVQSALSHESGQLVGYQSVIRDITKEIMDEKAIVAERDKAQRYLDIAGAIIVVLDRDGVVTLINQEGSEVLGCPIDGVIGKNWIDNYIPHSSQAMAKEDFSILLDGKQSSRETREIPILTLNGYERIVEWRDSAIFDPGGNVIGVVSSGVDITDRKQAEENLKSTADTARLYLDIMGHDIRNHLQAIVMGTDIMSHIEFSVEIQPIYELIVESVISSQRLINQVQATRDLLSTPLEIVSLSTIFNDFTEHIHEVYDDTTFHIESTVQNGKVLADHYLKILFENLVDNAVNHNPNKDRVVWIYLAEMNNGYLFSVKDNGTGITDLRKESLFDPGRRYGGVGIHQVKNIVEKYSGMISVGDRVRGDSSQGASFDVWIPMHKDVHNGEMHYGK
jgi:hypothetical protein